MNTLVNNACTLQNNIFPGLFVGQNLVTLKEVDSTNNFLKEIASNSKPVPEGTVIMAESQFAGRGQKQNGWFADPGKNLTFSILLKPFFVAADKQFILSQAISIAVVKALQNVAGPGFKIKWPNDIFFNGKKIGGILIENMLQGQKINNCIAGIGINVNQQNFPEQLPNAISLQQILHKDYDLSTLLSEICTSVEQWYLKIKNGATADINEGYLQNLYGLNQVLRFSSNSKEFEGMIKGVTGNGLLMVEEAGATINYNLKEIVFLTN